MDFKDHELILYAEKEDDSIGPVKTGSYMAANHLADFYQIREGLEKRLLEDLLTRKISPVARFRELEEFTLAELASRTGISRRRVKKHQKYEHFLNATVKELQKYAEVFNIPVANFFQVIETLQDPHWDIGHNREKAVLKALNISQERTPNPVLVITHPVKQTN